MKKIKIFLLTKSIGLYINVLSFIASDKANQLAYALFSQPRKGKLTAEELPKVLQSAELETLEFDGNKVQTYTWKGNDNVILLVHGWESNASRWKKFIPHLKKAGSTLVAIDAPAHGLSSGKEFNIPKYAEFINEVVQKHQPKTIIGHSIGGASSVYYLRHYANPSVEKLVLMGAPSDMRIIIDNYVQMLSLNSSVARFLENQSEERFNIKIDDFSGHLFAAKFNRKGLIVHDSEDKVVLVAEGKKYAKSWKDAVYIETSGLGHSMNDEKLYATIINFIHKS